MSHSDIATLFTEREAERRGAYALSNEQMVRVLKTIGSEWALARDRDSICTIGTAISIASPERLWRFRHRPKYTSCAMR